MNWRDHIVCDPAVLGGKPDRYPNLTVKKNPRAVLARCEWGKAEYSLQIENLPTGVAPAGAAAARFRLTRGPDIL